MPYCPAACTPAMVRNENGTLAITRFCPYAAVALTVNAVNSNEFHFVFIVFVSFASLFSTERGANKHAGGQLISDWKCQNGSRVVNHSVHERLTIQGMRETTHSDSYDCVPLQVAKSKRRRTV